MILTAVFSYSCASTPEAEPVVQEESSDDVQGLKGLEEKAKGAIARAESAGAAELSPGLLDEAYRNLRNGQEKNPKTDGGAQQDQYLTSIDKANQAYDDAVKKSQDRWLLTIENYEADLDKLNAPLYFPEYDGRSRELLQQLRDKIDEGNNDESLALYQFTIPNVDAVVVALVVSLDWLDQLRQEVTGLMGEASRQDLHSESAKLEDQGRSAYNSAMGHRSRGDMQSMEQDLYDARYYLREALRRSGALDPNRIDALLRSVQKRLEAASKRKVVDEDGNEIEVEPWNGDSYLQKHPLVDLSQQNQPGPRRRDESQLQQPQVSSDFLSVPVENGSLSWLEQSRFQLEPASGALFRTDWQFQAVTQRISEIPEDRSLDRENSRERNPFGEDKLKDGAPRVNHDMKNLEDIGVEEPFIVSPQQEYDDGSQTRSANLLSDAQLLLKQAASNWGNGVSARNKGNLPKAQHYFEETGRLIDQYNVQYAILGYYTVRKLKPEDCLWRIAGYSDIYGDPYQWTRIYQRNRNIIRNPSLIYPGQRLVIPPSKER